MINDSFLLSGNFIPIQMFSSVCLNYSNNDSSALGKAKTSPSLLQHWQESNWYNKEENLAWEIFSVNWLLCYSSVSNELAKKFVRWHEYVTGSQELLLLLIMRSSQLPLWADSFPGEWDSFLTVPLFCMFDQAPPPPAVPYLKDDTRQHYLTGRCSEKIISDPYLTMVVSGACT